MRFETRKAESEIDGPSTVDNVCGFLLDRDRGRCSKAEITLGEVCCQNRKLYLPKLETAIVKRLLYT
jgi:hypothetical protein